MCGCIGMWFYVICYGYMLYKTLIINTPEHLKNLKVLYNM